MSTQKVEIAVDFKSLEKAARALIDAGSGHGDTFVEYGREVKKFRAMKIGWLSIWTVGANAGVHDFKDASSLRACVVAFEFSEMAESKYGVSTKGIYRSFYAALSSLSRRQNNAQKGTFALTVDEMKQAIVDARGMSYPQFREKYFPKKDAVVTVATEPAAPTVDAIDCFEFHNESDAPETMADIVAMVRSLTLKAFTLTGENGINDVLACVVAVNDENAAPVVEETPSESVLAVA